MTKSFLSQNKIIHGNTKGQIGIYSYLVENMIKLFLLILIENVSVLWLVSHVQLDVIHWLEISQHFVIVHLTFNEGKHAVAYTHYWEMLIRLFIKSLSPKENFLDLFSVWKIAMGDKGFKIAGNVQTI